MFKKSNKPCLSLKYVLSQNDEGTIPVIYCMIKKLMNWILGGKTLNKIKTKTRETFSALVADKLPNIYAYFDTLAQFRLSCIIQKLSNQLFIFNLSSLPSIPSANALVFAYLKVKKGEFLDLQFRSVLKRLVFSAQVRPCILVEISWEN